MLAACAAVALRRRDRIDVHWRGGGPRPGYQPWCLEELVVQGGRQLVGFRRDRGWQRPPPPPRRLGALEAARVTQRLAEAPLGCVRRAALEAARLEGAGQPPRLLARLP